MAVMCMKSLREIIDLKMVIPLLNVKQICHSVRAITVHGPMLP